MEFYWPETGAGTDTDEDTLWCPFGSTVFFHPDYAFQVGYADEGVGLYYFRARSIELNLEFTPWTLEVPQ